MNGCLKVLIVIAASSLAGCNSSSQHSVAAIDAMNKPASTPTQMDWERFGSLRIAFGHQSVGFNLMAGVATLAAEQQRSVTITETRESFAAPGIHHFKVGSNGDPAGKLTDFEAAMNSGLAQSSDIALLKFCYIDFEADDDPRQLAAAYIAELAKLSTQYPHTRFAPVTAPLTTVQAGPKAWLKQLIGRTPAGYASNARRHAFNQALREYYGATGALFDIAALESASGQVNVNYQNQRIEALDPGLTDDGGHLNSRGQRLIGGALVHHLASIESQ